MKGPKIVGLSGKIESGKSTLAGFLVEKNTCYQKHSIADPLKEAVADILGVPLEWCYDKDKKQTVVGVPRKIKFQGKVFENSGEMQLREFIQWYGTDVVRSVDNDYWINKLFERIGNKPAIIDDVRFLNEADKIKKAKGALLRIEVYRERGKRRGDNHKSEVDLDDYDGFDMVITPKFGGLAEVAQAIDLMLVKRVSRYGAKIIMTEGLNQYIRCHRKGSPLKNIEACRAICPKKCKVIGMWCRDLEKFGQSDN